VSQYFRVTRPFLSDLASPVRCVQNMELPNDMRGPESRVIKRRAEGNNITGYVALSAFLCVAVVSVVYGDSES